MAQTPPPWIDEAMLEYLMSTGEGAGTPIGDYTLPPEDMDEYGTMDWQGSRLTQLNKGANLSSSLPFILGLGAGPGGAAPEAFNPVVTYAPVKVPGAQQLEAWKNDGDPIHTFVYNAVTKLKWSEEQVRTYLLNVLTDPGNEFYDEYIASVPPQIVQDEVTGADVPSDQPDINYTLGQVSNLYKTIASDDPWDGKTFDPTTGKPARAIEEDSPLMAELKKAGYSNTPYDTYDPWSFAPEGQTPESLTYSNRAAGGAKTRADLAGKKSRDQNMMLTAMLQGAFPLEPSQDQVGPRPAEVPPEGDGTFRDENEITFGINRLGEGEEGAKIPIPWFQRKTRTTGRIGDIGQAEEPRRAGLMDQMLEKGRQNQMLTAQRERSAAASRGNMRAYGDSVNANADAGRQKYDAMQRQKMVEALLAQGRAPFYDQQRARQQQVWGI